MKILVTGAKGFVGKNLCAQLNNIKEGKARCYGDLTISEVYEYDIDSTPEQLDKWCHDCDFVFNLAGVNRPQNTSEFMEGNFGFASTLLDTLKKHGNKCPIMLSSSQQASLSGRFGNSEYGRSKKAGEDLFLQYEAEFLKNAGTQNLRNQDESAESVGLTPRVLIYRFPNLYGKWCRPNYNSAVATFCNNIANDLPIKVNDPSVELELLYIDDLVDEMISALKGEEHRCEFNGLEVIASPQPSPKGKGVKTADPAWYHLLKEKAEHNRKYPTEAEAVLWNALRGNALGVKFRRQHIIGDYLADFYCVDKGLIIEVDGGYHFEEEQQKLDALRTQFFKDHGFIEIRFKNEEVMFKLEEVLSRIQHILQSPLLQEGQGEAPYCYCPITHKATLGQIVDLLNQFKAMPQTLLIPEISSDSFAKRLYSTYLSYLPKEGAIFDLKMNVDDRGSFTELIHTPKTGQVSINISKPGITKGQHWHHTKWEQFIVVKGHGLIQMRNLSPALLTREGEKPYNTADSSLYAELKEKAVEMRKNPTEAESAMWDILRRGNLKAKFRRQHIIGDYIVDFVDLVSGLVVEIDGGYHNKPEQKILDSQRTDYLQKQGFSVIRFTNEEVLFKTDETVNILNKALSLVGRVGERPILNYFVSGNKIQSVIMLPGYTHNIINLSDTEDLVTVMYCNEIFDPNKPDTFFDPV